MPSPDLNEMYKELTGFDISNAYEIPVSNEIDMEISSFVKKNTSLSENDISDYARFLTFKHGGNDRSIQKDLLENIFSRVILLKMRNH
ncbi:MAG: hypothetical protein Q7J35_09350 [Candidatus Methanoperedens sp.]|jgi:hypothetical protein|nr:hypothetical protein [Candidatus Methanoperedens sp.]